MSKELPHLAPNYNPLPVELASGDGAWLTDTNGERYLDCLAGFAANNFGYNNPDIRAAVDQQLDSGLLHTGRGVSHDQMQDYTDELSALVGKDVVLPLNSGNEAVEAAVKYARRWAYDVKGVEADKANIIVARNNFHGRSLTTSSLSTNPKAYGGFGPLTPGFRWVDYGDVDSLTEVIDANTAAVLIEPVQGEAGVVVPPAGYMQDVRDICDNNQMLFIDDEIQAGLGRTGKTLAIQHDGVEPDMYILGKALGGGVLPVSAVAANRDIMSVVKAGEHGNTFGGNPLACAIGKQVVKMLQTGVYQENSRIQGAYMNERLQAVVGHGATAVRGRGLWAGIDIDPQVMTSRDVCEKLLARHVLANGIHGATIRFSPPLTLNRQEVDFAVDQLAETLHNR